MHKVRQYHKPFSENISAGTQGKKIKRELYWTSRYGTSNNNSLPVWSLADENTGNTTVKEQNGEINENIKNLQLQELNIQNLACSKSL